MQLELQWYPPNCVRAVLADYLAMRSDGITAETRDDDYRWRVEWLLQAFGDLTPAVAVTFGVLERSARLARGIIRDVTIRRRLRFWRSAMRYAAQRGVVPKESIPELPPWLKDDGQRCEDFYSTEQFHVFRLSLPPGRYRRFADLAMWTGMHTLDVCATERRHLESSHAWEGTDVQGRWWRRNHKNASPRRQAKVQPCFVPMEPELRELAVEWLAEPGPADGLVVGRLNNLRRTFHEAAARAGLPLIRPNLGLRASHSTMLMARGYSYEYVRLVLGHIGEVSAYQAGDHLRARTASPSTLSRHYLRPSPETLRPASR